MKACAAKMTLLLALHLSTPAFGWGDEGHRITGHIATAMLMDAARRELRGLLGSDDLSLVATWMDDRRADLERQYLGSSRWHYENRPVCAQRRDAAIICPRGDCITQQIERHASILRNRQATRERRAEAVRILVHLVGDLHQPLHLADNGDRGGNDLYVLLPRERDPRRLHEVWDTRLLRMNLRRRDEANYARSLSNSFESKRAIWQRGDTEDWAHETYLLGKQQTYRTLPRFACGAREAQAIDLPDAYIQTARKTVDEQLAKAGIRIAVVLNAALGR